MQIHELNNYNGSIENGYLVMDDGSDTGKLRGSDFLAPVKGEISDLDNTLNARIDNIIAGGAAPSEAEIIDAREGIHEIAYPSLGAAIRSQVSSLSEKITDIADNIDMKFMNQTVSGTHYVDIPVYIPAGIYQLNINNVVSTDTDNPQSAIIFYQNDMTTVATIFCNRGVEINSMITLSSDVQKIRFLAGAGYPSSAGDTFTYSDVVISIETELQKALNLKLDTVSQYDLDFAEITAPNLFDVSDPDANKPGYWYYSTNIGSVVSPQQNAYTYTYHAIKCKAYKQNKVTVGLVPGSTPAKLYWIGATDADMKLLSYQIVNANMPYTFDLPEGTEYIVASPNIHENDPNNLMVELMVVFGSELPASYSAYETPYFYLEDCRADAADSPTVSEILTITGSGENIIKFKAPDSYDLVVGDTFQLFYKGLINAPNPECYDVLAECTQGSAFERYFEITPTSAGTVSLTLTLYGINHNVLDTKTISLNVSAKATSPGSQKNILCVGDSLTQGGAWVEELHRRLTGSGGSPAGDGLTNINFIGTVERNGVKYEGYGGWTFAKYNAESVDITSKYITATHDKTEAQDQHSIYQAGNGSRWRLETIEAGSIKIDWIFGDAASFPVSGTLTWVSGGVNHSNIDYTDAVNAPGNPFWDEDENKVDFGKYAQDQGVSSIDYVYVLLGWNNAASSENGYKQAAQTFIDNVQADFPNAKIVLMGLQIPARDGLGFNYGANGVYSKYWNLMQFVFNLDTWYQDLVDANSNVYTFNLSGQFDTEYNMPTTTKQVNTRNTEAVTMQSNGVHPANTGYMQIADAAYRDITAKL